MIRRGYVLLETVITLTCLIILIIPLIKTVDLIAKDKAVLKENRQVRNIMDEVSDDIKYSKSPDEVAGDRQIEQYEVSVNISDTYEDNLYRFDIRIKKDEDEKAQFFAVKWYH